MAEQIEFDQAHQASKKSQKRWKTAASSMFVVSFRTWNLRILLTFLEASPRKSRGSSLATYRPRRLR